MSIKRSLVGGGIAAMGLLLASTLVAGAQTVPTPTTTTAPASTPTPKTQPMVLEVNAGGRVLLRGTIDSVGSGTLTVKSWGGEWTVNVPSSAEVLPGGDASKFSQGDFVGVLGAVSESGSWAVNAKTVHDWTYGKTVNAENTQNRKSARQEMESERARTYQGTASAVSASSITLTTANGTAYTVNFASNARFLNKKWGSITVGDIQNGDTVRAFGTNANGTITATVVRDISLPKTGK